MFFLSIAAIFIFSFIVWQYFFNIYEVDYELSAKKTQTSQDIVLIIKTIPLNSLGKRVPFKIVRSEFSIIEGNELVNREGFDKTFVKCILKKNIKSGKMVIKIKSDFSICPAVKVINI